MSAFSCRFYAGLYNDRKIMLIMKQSGMMIERGINEQEQLINNCIYMSLSITSTGSCRQRYYIPSISLWENREIACQKPFFMFSVKFPNLLVN